MVVQESPDLRDPDQPVGRWIDHRDVDRAATDQVLQLLPPVHGNDRVVVTDHHPEMGEKD
jgi:hypothetical protein